MEQSGLSSFCLNVVAGMAQSVGWLSMVTCQAHTMQPEVLVHVCLSVGELDVDATDAPLAPAAYSNLFQQTVQAQVLVTVCTRRISVSPGLLAKLQTLQTVEHPQPADSPLEPASMSDERVATMQETHPQAAERATCPDECMRFNFASCKLACACLRGWRLCA